MPTRFHFQELSFLNKSGPGNNEFEDVRLDLRNFTQLRRKSKRRGKTSKEKLTSKYKKYEERVLKERPKTTKLDNSILDLALKWIEKSKKPKKTKIIKQEKNLYDLFESSSDGFRMDELPEMEEEIDKTPPLNFAIQLNFENNEANIVQSKSFSNISNSKTPKHNSNYLKTQFNEEMIRIEDLSNTPKIIVNDIDVRKSITSNNKIKGILVNRSAEKANQLLRNNSDCISVGKRLSKSDSEDSVRRIAKANVKNITSKRKSLVDSIDTEK